MNKRWSIQTPISQEVRDQFPELDPVVLQLLFNRGVTTKEAMDLFLSPDWDRDTHDPFVFSNMNEAVARVFQALEKGEVITVHGDYDADGVCGSAVLLTTLRDIARKTGADESTLTNFIPDREKDGYGMSVKTIDRFHEEKKTRLVITVDCGISNKDAIDRGKELGIDTIVCDHHAMPKELPTQAILIHPQVPGEPYPNKHLCGTAVAYKLASALIIEARKRGVDFPKGYEKWLLDLVGIATVTDVMPLLEENRVLETYGLLVLNKTRRVGLQKLIDIAGGKLGQLDTMSIGFMIGPRINAAGRMTHAQEALDLMIEEDELKATQLAMQLQETNALRQKASNKMYEEAKRLVGDVTDQRLIIIHKEGWAPGLVGLVAGKILSDYGLPVFVVGKEGEKFVGSGRSPDGFDVTQALHAAGEHLDKFGGHPQACGFSTTGEDRFAKAVEVMQAYAKEHVSDDMLIPTLTLDVELELNQIDWSLLEGLNQLEPYGRANDRPMFCSKDVEVASFAQIGKTGAHLRLSVRSKDGTLHKCIAFRKGHLIDKLSLGQTVNIAYELSINEWNGNRDIQLRIEDIQL